MKKAVPLTESNLKQAIETRDYETIKQWILDSLCLNHSGKMESMISVSTSVKENKQCQLNALVEGSICQYCYAEKLVNMRKSLREKLIRNHILYTKYVLPIESIPFINAALFRFEAFGDLNNDIQVINYFNICRVNPFMNAALWSKNPIFIDKAIKAGNEKPDNLRIVYSSPFLNTPLKSMLEKYPFIDKLFTVYTKEYIKENNIIINCGFRKCILCRCCYFKNNVKMINEEKK